eukprot:151526-Rhodomonas_salina.1
MENEDTDADTNTPRGQGGGWRGPGTSYPGPEGRGRRLAWYLPHCAQCTGLQVHDGWAWVQTGLGCRVEGLSRVRFLGEGLGSTRGWVGAVPQGD